MKNKISVGEMFAGVGGFRVGLEKSSKLFDTVWSNQYEPSTKKQHASEIYVKNFGASGHSNEDINTVKTDNIPDLDLLVGGFPCFVKGTAVLTDKGYKEINNIQVGDEVLTHSNRFRRVTTPMKQDVDKYMGIKVYGTPIINCTENHPFYCIERETHYKNRKKVYSYTETPKWIEAKDLRVNKHYVGININTNSIDLAVVDGIPLDNEVFYWFMGRYLADGWYQDNPRTGRINSNTNKVFLCCGFHESEEVDKKLKKMNLHYTTVKERTVIKFIFSNKKLMNYMKMFGKYAHGKIIPNEIQDLPIDKLKHFIEGYRSGDGCISIKENNLHKITTVSESIALGIQNIIHKVYNLPCRISRHIPKSTTGREVNQRTTYAIAYRLETNREKILVRDGKLWFPVRNIKNIQEKTTVYNIEVEEDESYTVNNLIVHNCQDYSIACSSNRADGIVGKKGVLWWDIVRIIQEKAEKAPKYLMFENVDRLLISPSNQRGKDFAIILSSLNDLGYIVEWRVVNAAEYGMPQKRKRVFIFAYKPSSKLGESFKTSSLSDVITTTGIFARAFPIDDITEVISGSIGDDLVEITNTFNIQTPKKNAFLNAGVMVDGVYYSAKVTPKFDGIFSVLGDHLEPEENIPQEFYIAPEPLKKWQYMKGSKSFQRVSKTGHEYTYSEGSMAFPDSKEKPARTIITGEGGPGASRFKHVIQIGDKYRRLTPVELERLMMFPDNHTEGVSDTKRAFLLGNALMCGIVTKLGDIIDELED